MSTARRLLLIAILLVLAAPAAASAAKPLTNDPLVTQQWHLGRGGDNVDRAWKTSRGGAVKVAIIDSGVDMNHADLAKNIWTNPREIAGNGVDDDANGLVDDVHGWDFVEGDADPTDANGHGTHVAGILAARGRNHIGGTGVAQKAQVMVLRVLDHDNNGTTGNVAAALRYAVANGARVANLSLNTATPDPAVDAAIAEANAAGVLVIVSAGNDHQDLGATPSFPACSTSPNVIAVAATGRSGAMAPFSNFGPSCVDVAAPGVDIASTRLGGGYEARSGTSMATPQVAGAAVLLLAARPSLTVAQLRASLLDTAVAAPGATLRSAGASVAPRRLDVARGLRAALRAA